MTPEMKLALIRGHLFGLIYMLEDDSGPCEIDGYRYIPDSALDVLLTFQRYVDDVIAVTES